MWNEEQQHLFDGLREKEFAGTLTDEEQKQLEKFFEELDAEEAELLRPAMERYDRKIAAGQQTLAALRVENELLETIVARRKALLARAKEIVAQFQAEDRALRAEYERIVSHRQAAP